MLIDISENQNAVNIIDVSNFFSHPFVLLVSGATITSYLIPKITNRWQDYRKKSEIKVELVTQISEIVALVRIIAFSALTEKKTIKSILEPESKTWVIKSEIIFARLKAYFKNNSIPDDWLDFKRELMEFWSISLAIADDETKKIDVSNLRKFFPRANETDLKSIENKLNYESALVNLEGMIMTDGELIMDQVLKTKINSF